VSREATLPDCLLLFPGWARGHWTGLPSNAGSPARKQIYQPEATPSHPRGAWVGPSYAGPTMMWAGLQREPSEGDRVADKRNMGDHVGIHCSVLRAYRFTQTASTSDKRPKFQLVCTWVCRGGLNLFLCTHKAVQLVIVRKLYGPHHLKVCSPLGALHTGPRHPMTLPCCKKKQTNAMRMHKGACGTCTCNAGERGTTHPHTHTHILSGPFHGA
jgi:hypothetical protein